MTWLTPALGLIAAAVAVPLLLLLYFLKLRRRVVEVSSTFLWKRAVEDLQANAPFQRLRRNLLLLLQLLALGGLLAALAQPVIPGISLAAGRHVIVLDVSASMGSMDGAEGGMTSRMARAKREARAVIDALAQPSMLGRAFGISKADEAMVVAFGSSAHVVQTWTSDREALRRAVDSLEATDTPTRFGEALALIAAQAPKATFIDDKTGTEFTRGQGRVGTIHIFTDGKIPDAPQTVFGPEDDVRVYPVGSASAANVGIVAVRADREFGDPSRLGVFVGVQSTDTRPRTVDVELRVERWPAGGGADVVQVKGASLAAATREDPASETSRLNPALRGVEFSLDMPDGALVTARLVGDGTQATDVLGVDNTAWLVVPRARRLAVALVSESPLGIREVLEELGLARVEVMTPADFERRMRAGGDRAFDVVVTHNWVPAAPASSGDCLPPGRYLVLGAAPPPPQGLVDRGLEEGTIAAMVDWDREHPATRSISLDKVLIGEPRRVELGPDGAARVLATSTVGPAIVEITGSQCKAIVVTFDPMGSMWTLDPSWVVFVGSAVHALGKGESAATEESVRPGLVFKDRVAQGAGDVRVRQPDNTLQTITPAPDGSVVFGPVERAGVHRLEWVGPAGDRDVVVGERSVRLFAANLADPAESDVPTVRSPAFASTRVVSQSAQRGGVDAPRPLWHWIVLAAVGALLVEWWVYNRRVYL